MNRDSTADREAMFWRDEEGGPFESIVFVGRNATVSFRAPTYRKLRSMMSEAGFTVKLRESEIQVRS